MTFRQHQKFLLTRKKYYSSYYETIPYSKFSSQPFHGSNCFLSGFQFSIKKFGAFNFKHTITKTPKKYSLFWFHPIADYILSGFPARKFSLLENQTRCSNQQQSGTQLTNSFFFFKQTFAFKTCASKWNDKSSITTQNLIRLTNETRMNALAKRQRFIRNSLKGILLVNFPEKEKNFLIKNLAAENKIALITQSASLLLKDSRNMDDLLGVDDPIQILFDRVKTCLPCICFINNLDRIGKQRYEQEHKSFSGLNNLISLLIDHNPKHHPISKTINQKELLNLATTSFSGISQTSIPFLSTAWRQKNAVVFESSLNAGALQTKHKVSLFDHDFQKTTWRLLKNFKTHRVAETFFNTKITFNQKFNNGYYHRLPFWLLKNRQVAFLKQKRSIDQVKVFNSLYHTKNKKKTARWLTSLQLRLNSLPLQIGFSQIRNYKTSSIFEKTEYNTVDSKTHLDNPYIIHNRSLLKNSLTESESTELFEKKLKPVAKKNLYSLTSSKKKPPGGFKDLGKIAIGLHPIPDYILSSLEQRKVSFQGQLEPDQKKIHRVTEASLNSTKKNIIFEASSGFGIKTPNGLDNDADNHFSKNYETGFNNMPINPPSGFTELTTPDLLSSTGIEGNEKFSLKISETEIIKRTALLKFLQILDGFHTTTGKRKNATMLCCGFPNLSVFRLGTSTKNNFQFQTSLKRQYSKWFKRFVMSVGPHLEIPHFNWFKSKETTNSTGVFKRLLTLPKKNNLKLSKLKTDHKHSLCNKNFLAPMVFQKKPNKYNKALMINSIQNNKLFSKTTSVFSNKVENTDGSLFNRSLNKEARFKKLKKTPKYSIYGAVMPLKYKNDFLGYLSTTKKASSTFGWFLKQVPSYFSVNEGSSQNLKVPNTSYNDTRQSISFANEVPKWKLYIKNQPALKSLNLLCVWPSYIEEILGPHLADLNDGASYLLPEYFQLLGHGPKLKKQGITLIASTNNLTTLDAALLRPGRFDTVINFSHSSSFINKSWGIPKHSPSLSFTPSLSTSYVFFHKEDLKWNDKSRLVCRHMDKHSLFTATWWKKREHDRVSQKLEGWPSNGFDGPSKHKCSSWRYGGLTKKATTLCCGFSLSESLITKKKIVDFSIRPLNYSFKHSMAKKKSFLVFLKKNHDFLFNNAILIPLFSSINVDKTIKNQFNPQVTVLDMPIPSIPIKTFIDVSVFIQYKLWWSFNNNKFSWLGLYQKQKTGVSDSEKFEISSSGFSNIHNVGLILKSRQVAFKIKDSTSLLIGILSFICFKFFSGTVNFYMILKTKFANKATINNFHTNKTEFIDKTFINQNSDSVNVLSREVLISKLVADNRDAYFSSNMKNKRSVSPIFDIKVPNALDTDAGELPKSSNSMDYSLDQYRKSKKETWTLSNFENHLAVVKSFIRHAVDFHTEYNNIFLKSNRSLLFCIGDIDYKTYLQKDFDFFSADQQNQTNNIIKSQPMDSIKIGQLGAQNPPGNFNNKTTKTKNAFLKPQQSVMAFRDSAESISLTTTFLDQSSKTWKDGGKAALIKNDNGNCTMLNKYNEIYKIKKIKLKQQSFFNLHPFISFMLKRWPKVTKSNKLKRHFKISLVSVFSELLAMEQAFSFCEDKRSTQKNVSQLKNFFMFPWSSKNTDASRQEVFTNQLTDKNGNIGLPWKNEVDDFSKPLGGQNSWFFNWDFKSLYNQIYRNLYSSALLVPISSLLLKKNSLKTLGTNNFFSIYESYLFRKLTRNSSLNIICLQIDPTLIGLHPIVSYILSSLEQRRVSFQQQAEPDLKKKIIIRHAVDLKNETRKASVFSGKSENTETIQFLSYKPITWKNWISNLGLPQTKKNFKKIPRKTVINYTHDYFQKMDKLQCFNFKTDLLKNNNVILLKNLVSNEKKDYNLIKTKTLPQSPFQKYKMYQASPEVSFQAKAKEWSGTQLDTSFFLLMFYTMFFEKTQAPPVVSYLAKPWSKTQQKKIIFNTIKIFMPYKSLVFSHFLLSQNETFGFSCKNFEILIYNKFKNFLVNF